MCGATGRSEGVKGERSDDEGDRTGEWQEVEEVEIRFGADESEGARIEYVLPFLTLTLSLSHHFETISDARDASERGIATK